MEKEKSVYLVYSLNEISDGSLSIKAGKPLFFSDKEKAENMIAQFKERYAFLYDEKFQEEKVYCLIMEEFAMDTPYRYQLSTRVYTPEGVLINDCNVPDDGPFTGRQPSSMDHHIGDLVEIPHGDKLLFGVVAEMPVSADETNSLDNLGASDDYYTVIQHPTMEIDYAYSPFVFKPVRKIPENISCQLYEALAAYQKKK
jgi:hypothetical protein